MLVQNGINTLSFHKNPLSLLALLPEIDTLSAAKFVIGFKVNTERLGDLDRFPFPNGLLVMSVEELKRFQNFG